MMRHKVLVLICSLALLFLFGAVSLAGAQEKEPVVGQTVKNVHFPPTITAEGSKYLGLAKQGPFSLRDIKAPYVVVEQFNTSCPHCMAQAPVMDALFDKVENDPALKAKVKFLGAGQGNQDVQVKMWKTFHKVRFAMVPDPTNSMGKALNFTPYPVTVLLNNKTGKILLVQIGTFENADEVLQKIKQIVK